MTEEVISGDHNFLFIKYAVADPGFLASDTNVLFVKCSPKLHEMNANRPWSGGGGANVPCAPMNLLMMQGLIQDSP